jgi:hypothetical protein
MLDNETTSFYLDGSPKQFDFVSREKPFPIDWPNFNPEIEWSDSAEVLILRASLFFHAGQKITLGKLREFFTPKAIKLLEKDGYIKIIIDHGEPE